MMVKDTTVLFCLLLTFLFSSCSIPYELSDFFRQKLTYNGDCQTFLIHRHILVPVDINGEKDTLMFDTGASFLILKFSTAHDSTKKVYQRRIQAPDGIVNVGYAAYIPDVSNRIWHFQNTLATELFVNKTEHCHDVFATDKLIGFRAVSSVSAKHKSTLLNFSDNTLCYSVLPEGAMNDYTEVPSSFEKGLLYIYLNIGGHQAKFLFDTGNDMGLILGKTSENIVKDMTAVYALEGAFNQSLFNIMLSDCYIYDSVSIAMNEHTLINTYLSLSTSLVENNAGLMFLKNFDWIIDAKNKKVYAKRLQSDMKLSEKTQQKIVVYGAANINGELQFIFRTKNDDRFSLFKKIKAINGITITKDNICEYREYLNNVDNWDEADMTITFESNQ